MNKEQIMEIIPHRDPFLLIDEIEELEPGKRVVAYKNMTPDEFWFKGHFPDYPVVPGVLMVEMMAQGKDRLLRRHQGSKVPPPGSSGRQTEDRGRDNQGKGSHRRWQGRVHR